MSDTPQLEPSIIVIFGVTGDLSKRYLLPALYKLFKNDLLHEKTIVVGLTRQSLTADELFSGLELSGEEAAADAAVVQAMRLQTELVQFDPNQPTDYPRLLQHLNDLEERAGVCMNRLYYLSIPPAVFTDVVHQLGEAGLNGSCQHGNAKTRLLVEKPFGHDLESAQQLIQQTDAVFTEEQVYRIDHYLAKETVQNILSFRLHNPIFTDVWSARYIQSIAVTAHEKIGIAGRVNFYEGLGALRDLVQSHLLQLVAITTMDLPSKLDGEHVHRARQMLLESVAPADPWLAHRAQYDTYREEVSNPTSITETFAQLTVQIETERWEGMPVTITTGKALEEKRTDIVMTFSNPHDESNATNTLTFRLQPDEGIHLQLRVKRPGYAQELQDAVMDFSYDNTFGSDSSQPGAYERVLVDAIRGDRTLFATSDEVLASWRIIQPLIDAWRDNDDGLQSYKSGTSGPGLVQ